MTSLQNQNHMLHTFAPSPQVASKQDIHPDPNEINYQLQTENEVFKITIKHL